MSRNHKASAQELLANPVFTESLDALQQLLFKQWGRSKNIEEREQIYSECKAVEKVLRYVKGMAEEVKNHE